MSKPNLAPAVVGAMTVELALSLAAVSARIYTRTCLKRYFGWDDVLVVLGMVLFFGYCVAMYVSVGRGYGKPSGGYPLEQVVGLVYAELIAQTFAVLAFIPAKCAVAATMMRVFPGKWLHGILWFWIISMTGFYLACAIMDFTQCDPSAHMWDPTIPATCWDPNIYARYSVFCGAFGAAMDFYLAIIPWWYLIPLPMGTKEKIGIASAMSLGVFAGVCAVVKSIVLINLSSRTDYAYDTVSVILWSSTEICLILIAASIPLLRPFLLKLRYGTADSDPDTPLTGSVDFIRVGPKVDERSNASRDDDDEPA